MYTKSVVFSNKVRCAASYLYGEASMSFPAGLTGRCVVVAQGSIEIIGALDLETSDLSSEINIIAGADTVLWGSGR